MIITLNKVWLVHGTSWIQLWKNIILLQMKTEIVGAHRILGAKEAAYTTHSCRKARWSSETLSLSSFSHKISTALSRLSWWMPQTAVCSYCFTCFNACSVISFTCLVHSTWDISQTTPVKEKIFFTKSLIQAHIRLFLTL